MTYVKKEDKFCCLFGSILKLYFIQYSLVCICNGHVKTMVQYAIHVLVYNHCSVRPVTLVLWFEWKGGGVKYKYYCYYLLKRQKQNISLWTCIYNFNLILGYMKYSTFTFLDQHYPCWH